ncbi:hypothetical protein DB35_25390 [Streptomyces abyssalis]|uniref:Uncharacterized protein n=1 Tax=Streptomyces abyssalis TaxID=933944 RepID=A0A1E7JN40_9ACTN|nr:hypothetical protein [Streptomyces abyssalis]OEU86924.1 hypothetical protein DB35_25390 [Streptomyces abyssalis]OEU89691.1 hypothetical protein AN215_08175 [Streptomyces abyssalis]OEV31302.1 hypothetical protein AN219_05535 [Streptomyces nanshensis]
MSHAHAPAPTSHRQGGPRKESPSKWTAFAVHTVADIAAAFVALWIVLHLSGADKANLFVQYVEDMAYWIAGWSQNISAAQNEHLILALNYGLPALVYLFIGHGIAARTRPGRVTGEREGRTARQPLAG